jgi:hypothetical protein
MEKGISMMTHKHFFLLGIMFLCIFQACSKDDGATNPENTTEQKYTGEWRGTTGANKTVYFRVDSENYIDTMCVKLVHRYGGYTITGNAISTTKTKIVQGAFTIGVSIAGVSYSGGSVSEVQGTFASPTECSGIVDSCRRSGFVTSSVLVFGTPSTQAEVSWTASK